MKPFRTLLSVPTCAATAGAGAGPGAIDAGANIHALDNGSYSSDNGHGHSNGVFSRVVEPAGFSATGVSSYTNDAQSPGMMQQRRQQGRDARMHGMSPEVVPDRYCRQRQRHRHDTFF
jgi:hypothetical protein